MRHTNEMSSTVNTTVIELTDSISYPAEQKQSVTVDSSNKVKDANKSVIEKFIKKTRFHIFGLLSLKNLLILIKNRAGRPVS